MFEPGQILHLNNVSWHKRAVKEGPHFPSTPVMPTRRPSNFNCLYLESILVWGEDVIVVGTTAGEKRKRRTSCPRAKGTFVFVLLCPGHGSE